MKREYKVIGKFTRKLRWTVWAENAAEARQFFIGRQVLDDERGEIMTVQVRRSRVDALLDRLRKELCDCGTYYNDPTEHADYCVYRKAVMEEKL